MLADVEARRGGRQHPVGDGRHAQIVFDVGVSDIYRSSQFPGASSCGIASGRRSRYFEFVTRVAARLTNGATDQARWSRRAVRRNIIRTMRTAYSELPPPTISAAKAMSPRYKAANQACEPPLELGLTGLA